MLASHLNIDRRQVEVELPGVLGFQGTGFQFHHHVAAQLQVIEEQVDEEVVVADLQWHLPAYVGEAGAQFEQKSE